MQYVITAFHRIFAIGQISDVAFNQTEIGMVDDAIQIVTMPRRKIIKTNYLMAFTYKIFAQVRTDKSGTARDQYFINRRICHF